MQLGGLGCGRRAPGELAVMGAALRGWPQAQAEAAQQGFRAARAVARAKASTLKGAVAPEAVLSDVGGDGGSAAAAALEWDSAAVAAAPEVAAAAVVHAAHAAHAATAAAVEATEAATRALAAADLVAASPPAERETEPGSDPVDGLASASASQPLGAQFEEFLVLELDHEWFALREALLAARATQEQQVGNKGQAAAALASLASATNFAELPWELQLDVAFAALAAAGAPPPLKLSV